MVNVVVWWLVDGEKCGKYGLWVVMFLEGENRHFFEVFFAGKRDGGSLVVLSESIFK